MSKVAKGQFTDRGKNRSGSEKKKCSNGSGGGESITNSARKEADTKPKRENNPRKSKPNG